MTELERAKCAEAFLETVRVMTDREGDANWIRIWKAHPLKSGREDAAFKKMCAFAEKLNEQRHARVAVPVEVSAFFEKLYPDKLLTMHRYVVLDIALGAGPYGGSQLRACLQRAGSTAYRWEGWGLYEYNSDTGRQEPSKWGLGFIKELLELFKVSDLSGLKNRSVAVLEGTGGIVFAISDDKAQGWVCPQWLAQEYG